MGQYHITVNLDKKEMLHPHSFGDGLKLLEFGASAGGLLQGLAILLAGSNGPMGRGGGDLHPWIDGFGSYGDGRSVDGDPAVAEALMTHVVGRWAGDRIAVIGDYFERGDVPGVSLPEDIFDIACDQRQGWVDISEWVVATMELDYYTAQDRHSVHVYPNGYVSIKAARFSGMSSQDGARDDRKAMFSPRSGRFKAIKWTKPWGTEGREMRNAPTEKSAYLTIDQVAGNWVTFTYSGETRVVSNVRIDHDSMRLSGQELKRGSVTHDEPQFKHYSIPSIQAAQA